MTNILLISDDKILRELYKGNHKALEQLFQLYYVLLCYEARKYIPEKYIVEELVNDVFLRLWENRETLSITSSLRGYLIRSIHNACLSHLRKNQVQIAELSDDCTGNSLLSIGESPLDYILSKELIEQIDNAIAELPPQYKRVFLLSRYEDKTYMEIADELNISVNTVKLYLKKALSKLRDNLYEFMHGPPLKSRLKYSLC